MERLHGIRLHDDTKLMDLPEYQRWSALGDINWAKTLKKTFKEKRMFGVHLLVNFSRVLALVSRTHMCLQNLFFMLMILY